MAGTPLVISALRLTAELRVADEVVEPNIGYLPWVLGANLAQQVGDYVAAQKTGYFPALDFFRGKPNAVDPALITLTDEVARFCVDYARRECRRRLSGIFSTTEVEREQINCYAIPRVRPRDPNAGDRLTDHFTPNRIRLELKLQSIQRGEVEELAELARVQAARNCAAAFAEFAVVDARVLTTVKRST